MTRLLPLLLLGACDNADEDRIPLHFDGPVAAAVLPMNAGPFDVPTGYVANQRNGKIVPLDLKMGRLLTDDPMASFLRSASITTGHARLLSDVTAVAGDDGSITLWAVDNAFSQLLRVPYVLSVDENGAPVENEPTVTDPVFVDADGSGDSPTLTDLDVRAGFTTTEDWSIEYDGTRWWAKGSRSGTMLREPTVGESWMSDNGEVEFTLKGTATLGDRFEFHTDTGVQEYTLDVRPTAVLAVDTRVYVSVASTPGSILVYDGVTGTYEGSVMLGDGSQPSRLSAAPDGRLFVADGALPTVWVIRFDEDLDPSTVPVESIATDTPVIDVAWQGGYDAEDQEFDHLFVAQLGTLRVDVWDLAADDWFDPNPVTEEAEGVFLGSPVSGLAASVGDVELLHETEWDAMPRVPTVAVATGDGFLFQLEGATGCAVVDARGPHGPNLGYDGVSAYSSLEDKGDASDASLWIDDGTGEQIVPSSCGGVTRTETWTITYDSASQSWEVEGSQSGVQVNRAVEDVRYISDTGAISFLIAPGNLPATDGDYFEIDVDSGLVVAAGTDENEDGTLDKAWRSPGRPAAFETLSGPTGGGWDPVQRKQWVLVPAAGSDLVARLHLESGKSELVYQ